MPEFVFRVGDRDTIVEAVDEKTALIQFINTHWDLIDTDDVCSIELMGEIVEKIKVSDMPADFMEEQEEVEDEE